MRIKHSLALLLTTLPTMALSEMLPMKNTPVQVNTGSAPFAAACAFPVDTFILDQRILSGDPRQVDEALEVLECFLVETGSMGQAFHAYGDAAVFVRFDDIANMVGQPNPRVSGWVGLYNLTNSSREPLHLSFSDLVISTE